MTSKPSHGLHTGDYTMSDLIPIDQGRVLVSRSALKDPAVLATLTHLHDTNYEFRPHPTGYWNISDYD